MRWCHGSEDSQRQQWPFLLVLTPQSSCIILQSPLRFKKIPWIIDMRSESRCYWTWYSYCSCDWLSFLTGRRSLSCNNSYLKTVLFNSGSYSKAVAVNDLCSGGVPWSESNWRWKCFHVFIDSCPTPCCAVGAAGCSLFPSLRLKCFQFLF